MTEILGGLQLNELNCRTTLAASFALATDLAEGLVALGAADFREAHRVTARLVRTLASSGRGLSEADAKLIEDIAMAELGRPLSLRDEDLPALTDVDAAIRARTTIGGAAPERVLEAVAALRDRVAGHENWTREAESVIDAAEAGLLAAARKLAGGG